MKTIDEIRSELYKIAASTGDQSLVDYLDDEDQTWVDLGDGVEEWAAFLENERERQAEAASGTKTPTPFNISIEGYDVIAVMRRAYLSLYGTDEEFHYVFTALDSKGDAVVALWCDKEEISSLGEAGSWQSFKDPEVAIAFMINEAGVKINMEGGR